MSVDRSILHNITYITFINLYCANSTYSFQMRVTTMDKTIKILRTSVTVLIRN